MNDLEQTAARRAHRRRIELADFGVTVLAPLARVDGSHASGPARSYTSPCSIRAPAFVDLRDTSARLHAARPIGVQHRRENAPATHSSPSTNANADGPPPAIEQPSAPAPRAAALASRNPGSSWRARRFSDAVVYGTPQQ